jgi:hypothetical protein
MKRWIGSMGLVVVCACTQPDPAPNGSNDPDILVSSADAPPRTSPATSPSATPSAPETGTAVSTLAGEWRVAGIDGDGFDADHALTLSASDKAIDFDPDCAGADRQYAIDGLAFRARIDPAERDQPVCEIGLPAGTAEMWRAIDAATRIERTPSNGVLLSGGGHSVLLFSQ